MMKNLKSCGSPQKQKQKLQKFKWSSPCKKCLNCIDPIQGHNTYPHSTAPCLNRKFGFKKKNFRTTFLPKSCSFGRVLSDLLKNPFLPLRHSNNEAVSVSGNLLSSLAGIDERQIPL